MTDTAKERVTHTLTPIRFFARDRATYGWLSNFYPCRVAWAGVEWPSVEFAYVAAKGGDDPAWLARVRACQAPGQAKRLGRTVTLPMDWETRKVTIMHALLRQKFSTRNPVLLARLLATGTRSLEEDSPWDWFWGAGRDGRGRNTLGKLLMTVRAERRLETKVALVPGDAQA